MSKKEAMVEKTVVRYLAASMVILACSGCATERLSATEATAGLARVQPSAATRESVRGESAVGESSSRGEDLSAGPPRAGAPGSADAGATLATASSPFEPVYFQFDNATLNEGALEALSRNYDTLVGGKGAFIIEGYCDEVGEEGYNLALGNARAKAVEAYLVTRGVPAERLTTISYGYEYPANTEHDEAAYSMNRRVEIWPKGTPPPPGRKGGVRTNP